MYTAATAGTVHLHAVYKVVAELRDRIKLLLTREAVLRTSGRQEEHQGGRKSISEAVLRASGRQEEHQGGRKSIREIPFKSRDGFLTALGSERPDTPYAHAHPYRGTTGTEGMLSRVRGVLLAFG